MRNHTKILLLTVILFLLGGVSSAYPQKTKTGNTKEIKKTGNKSKSTTKSSKAKSTSKAKVKPEDKKFIVVLDAGHGGHDPGCQYSKVKEKDITLKIVKKVGKLLEDSNKDIEVIYTRDTDTFIELHERANIANEKHANIFVSIHCNANTKTSVFGTETYTMGTHKNEDNLKVAKRENEVITLEADFKEKYAGYDPTSPEMDIIYDLMQTSNMISSLYLGQHVQDNLKSSAKRTNRGVKQAGFLVLWQTAMTSVLIETGFLSNAAERKYLNSTKGQDAVAKAIYDGIIAYKKKYNDG